MRSISIVLSSYNGAKYIEEQLESIRRQSLNDFSVTICDDCSLDDTPAIIESYINDNQLDWSFTKNDVNRNWMYNFYSLLTGAQGDYVFPCDQDDIWLSDKVERMISVMDAHPEINVLACDVHPFSEEGGVITKGYTSRSNELEYSAGLPLVKLDEWSLYIHRPGCAYCVRRSFIESIEPFWNPEWPHDATLWRFAAATDSLALLEEPLVQFRRHGGNASDRKKTTRQKRMEELQYYIDMLSAIERFDTEVEPLHPSCAIFIASAKEWLEARLKFLSFPSASALVVMMKHRSYYATSRGLFVDLILGFGRKVSI